MVFLAAFEKVQTKSGFKVPVDLDIFLGGSHWVRVCDGE